MLQWVDTLIGLIVVLLTVSLMITILNQIVIALLNLRGQNLRWGIRLLLEKADININGEAKDISKKILTHPLLSDKLGKSFSSLFNYLRLATAISKKELINILELEKIQAEGFKYQLEKKIDDWFDSVMKRTSQLFTQNTRIISVVFAIILSFAMHLDFFSLFQQISSDADLRGSLVASSSTILEQAGNIIETPSAYTESIKQLSTNDTSAAMKNLARPPLFTNRLDAELWIREKLDNEAYADSVLKGYDTLLTANLDSSLTKLTKQYGSILDSLNKSSIQILPQPPHKYDFQYICGVLIMAAFLSLGAPFWFKVLKNLSALRSVLATKQDQETS